MGNTTFANRIKKLRTDKNMSMDALAKQLNVTKSRINMWENNGVVPRDEVLIQLSDYFGVSIDHLLGNDENEGKEPNEGETLRFLQRNLKSMNEEQLEKAKRVLSSVFEDLFNDDEE